MFFLIGCSADDGRPITGPTGPRSGTGTGGGKGDGSGTGGGQDQPQQPTDSTTTTDPTQPAPTSSAQPPAGKKGAAEGPCASNAECESGVCFVGANQSYCTVQCTAADAATKCVAPFTGTCNKQGFCKRD